MVGVGVGFDQPLPRAGNQLASSLTIRMRPVARTNTGLVGMVG